MVQEKNKSALALYREFGFRDFQAHAAEKIQAVKCSA